MSEKFEKYHATQAWFAKNQELHKSSRQQALEIMCRKIVDVMEIDRVGLWFFTIAREAIYEDMTMSREGEVSKGTLLQKKDYPIYFNRIEEKRVLASTDTQFDHSVSELFDIYHKPNSICSTMDAPIFSDGEMLGIICAEKIGVTREWDMMDKNFLSIAADSIGRIIEAEKRHTYEKELRHRINYLENDLRKKLEDLNEAKLSLDLALEGAQAGKWDWDIAKDKLSLNKTWFTKLYFEDNELPQTMDTFKSVVYPDDLEKVFEELNKHLEGKTIFYEARYRMITKTGDIQWVLDRGCVVHRDKDGHPLRIIGVNINVTPIIKFEQSLIISEQQLKFMIQSLPTPVAMFDRSFNYITCSSRWKAQWEDAAKDGDSLNFLHGFKELWLGRMQDALNGETISKDEDLVQVSSGTELWLRWVIQPWRNANEEIGGVIVMAENITARKETEMKLTQASKLSALGEMAGGIAHEINNPLSIIKGYVDLLKRLSSRHALKEEVLIQYIDKMDSTVGRISKIVNGMRRFSRESSMDEKVEYSINKIIEETLDICQERINNNGIMVEVTYFNGDPLILCRPVEISQVILNLINNSYQAIAHQDRPLIRVKCSDLKNKYQIEIIDSGDGIPRSVRQKLFQPFFTTKDIGVGTGLGLSISRGIIEEHDGRLYYENDSPNTTFVIKLPKMNN
jgi:PAS domain S-box-containing protein